MPSEQMAAALKWQARKRARSHTFEIASTIDYRGPRSFYYPGMVKESNSDDALVGRIP